MQKELVGGLSRQLIGHVWWHDVQVEMEKGEVWTAGLDGLVGVVRGEANTPEAARARCLQLAARIEIPGKQYRTDAAEHLSEALGGLELGTGIVL
ncbi:MAG: hypothetical protein GY737_00250 [Desulfobacteraceae bacterium]|nr:hypothetical protein [Desulfobacteraceae bacterium]